MRRAAALLVAIALLGVGCSGSDSKPGPPSGDEVIHGWTEAMYKGDYDKAARYFAKDAIIQQVVTIYLRTHEDAVAWGRSLPCRAKVTAIKPEPKGVLLASFKLFPGVHGTCPNGGDARVKFFIRKGLIETWRQLPDKPTPKGQSI